MKLAFSVTFSSSTPRCSMTIFFTRSVTSLMDQIPGCRLLRAISRARTGASSHSGSAASNAAESRGLVTHFGGRDQRAKCGETPSNHHHAAVDVQRMAGDVRSFLASQKHGRGRNIGRHAETSRRYGGGEPVPLITFQGLRHRGLDKPWSDAVDGDGPSRPLLGPEIWSIPRVPPSRPRSWLGRRSPIRRQRTLH